MKRKDCFFIYGIPSVAMCGAFCSYLHVGVFFIENKCSKEIWEFAKEYISHFYNNILYIFILTYYI